MKIATPLVAAGFVFAGLSAATAESGFETRNGVKNAPATTPTISQLTSAQPQVGPHATTRSQTPARSTDQVYGDWKYELVKGAR